LISLKFVSRRNKMRRNLWAQIWMRKATPCAGPTCKRRVRDTVDGVFVVRGGEAIGYCSSECLCEGVVLAAEQLRASGEIRADLLSGMGYKRGK